MEEPAVNPIISHYRILSKLGAGGMGEVYLAEDTKLDRKVAIKLLPVESVPDEQAKKRLIREAKAAAKLDHPNICAIHEVGEADGQSFIVMQYVEGETLASRIHRKPTALKESLDIAVQVTDALAEAHSRGIIHRDIKPANIMLTARGQVKVMDFGLAKVVHEKLSTDSLAETESLLTAPGVIMGTVPYMSPEQVRGETTDVRGDIFSFGAVLYEMVSGRHPFTAESMAETLSAILTREPLPLARYADAPDELHRIVRKCLEKDRERRYQTMRDLSIDLENMRRECETARITATHSGAATAHKSVTPTNTNVKQRSLLFSRRALAVIALVIVAAVALVYVFVFRGATAARQPEIKSLAVLPLVDLSGDPAQEYFADGMTEAIINNLTQIRALSRVISRTSMMRYKGSPKSLPEIAEELKVDAVIEGSVQRLGGRVRVTAKLIPAATDSPVWTREYERELADVLKLQSEVARAVADEIRIQLTAEERARLAAARSVNPEAHEAYLLGRYHLQRRNEENLKLSIGYFERAIQLDAGYAAAWAGLSFTWQQRGIWGAKSLREVEQPARNAALKALELDDSSAEAHTSLAQLKKVYDWDWAGSEQNYRRAIALDPGSVEAHTFFADLLMALGRHAEAINEIQTAERLDPLSPVVQSMFGRVLYRARNYEEAERRLKRTLELEARDYSAYGRLGDLYDEMGRYADAIASLEKAEALRSGGGYRGYAARRARVYARMGRRNEALRMLKDLQRTTEPARFPKLAAAGAWAALGDKDEAFRLLFSAVEERRELAIFFKEDPPFDSLHADPRWKELLRRMNFPAE